MVRMRGVQTIKYGYFREALEALAELNRVCREGTSSDDVLGSGGGVANELITEADYASLADFERETAAFYADPDVMKVWRSAAQHIIEGSGRSELIETAPPSLA